MEEKRESVELLHDAFNAFSSVSGRLEEQYAELEGRIRDLKLELAEKNRAVERSRRLAAMGEMAAKIAHEIRNPLGSISLFASMLVRDLKECEEAGGEKHRLAEHISKGIKTLDNLLSNMLLFSRNPEPRLLRVSMDDLIDEVTMMVGEQLHDSVTLKKVSRGDTTLYCDPMLMKQVLFNLILNASDAVGGVGEIVVEARRESVDEGFIEVEVTDNGPGMALHVQERIFDPFFTTKDSGTGLGLAIVASIVEAHGGSIHLSSIMRGDGLREDGLRGEDGALGGLGEEGTTFLIRLPFKGTSGVSNYDGDERSLL